MIAANPQKHAQPNFLLLSILHNSAGQGMSTLRCLTKSHLRGVGETIKQDWRGRCWDMLLDIVSAQKQLFYKSLLSSVNGELTASQKKASSGGARCTFSRSVIGFLAELANLLGGLHFVLLGCCTYFIPFRCSFSFSLFSSTLKVERGLGFLLLLNVDLAA